MSVSTWPLASSTWDKSEIIAILQKITEDRFTMGSSVKAMEEGFAKWNGSKFCIMVNSGSSANLLMIASLFFIKDENKRLKPGDEIIVPAVSWSTTYFPLQQYGLKLKFVDVDRDTFNLNVTECKKAITHKTRGILAVNLLGNPCDYGQLSELCNSHDLVLLEDNCESLGCQFEGIKGGSLGLMGTHSSYFSHHFSTMEGGYVTTNNEELYHVLISLRSHGWTRHLPRDNHVSGRKSDDPFEESFKFVLPGYNVRPLELSGAVGLEQLEKLEAFVEARRLNAKRFHEVFANNEAFRIQKETGSSSWFGFGLIVNPNRVARQRLLETLTKYSIEARPIVAGNFLRNPVVQYMDYAVQGDLPVANELHDSGLFLGNHHFDLSSQFEVLEKALKEVTV
jgi:CDP-6-deoxy-D-xylo-4-hexulose-3-dehydrase